VSYAKPDVWLSKWRIVIARDGGRVSGCPHLTQIGEVRRGRRIQVEPALLHELHHGRRRDRFRHRRDRAHRVHRHRGRFAQRARAERARIDRTVGVRHDRHDAGHSPLGDTGGQELVELGL
jgi:hypothetical protein